jgi:dihydrofolate reductase
MRTLKIMEHISLDGVIHDTADNDKFPDGDWTAPYRTPQGRDMVLAAHGAKFDLLLGRRTYDQWSDYWPKAPGGPMADSLNSAKKYVVTHRPESLKWGPFEGVGPDLVEGIKRIKSQSGPNLVLWGSISLTSTILKNDLADEVVLITYPLVVGSGRRLFAEGIKPGSFDLIGTQTTPTGVVLSQYKSAGALKTE